MADQKRSVSLNGSSGGGLYAFIGTLAAWFSTPSFTGWAGAGKSLLVGSGTAMGGSILGFAGAIVGGTVGVLLGAITGKSKRVCGVVGAVVGAVPLSVVGAFQGYDLSKEWLTATQPAAPTAASAPAVSAPTPAVTPLVAAPRV